MDMLPPQAPPALSQATNQEAVAAIGRLIDTHAWITEQEASLPSLPPGAGAADRHPFLHAHIAFWDKAVSPSPGAMRRDRWAVFAQRMAETMRDEATLRGLDGTLSTPALAMVRAFAGGGEGSAGIRAHELMLGETAYAGAVAITSEGKESPVLLFMPDRGWDEFADLQALHRETETRLRRRLVTDPSLPGIMSEDLEPALDGTLVSTRPIPGDAFLALVRRVIALQQDRIRAGWPFIEAARASDTDAPARYFTARVRPLLRLHPQLDIRAILDARRTRLVDAIAHERLQAAPDDVAADWREAAASYAAALRIDARARAEGAIRDTASLDTFVDNQLIEALSARQIDTAPTSITVEKYDRSLESLFDLTGMLSQVSPDRYKSPHATVPLRELAMQNVSLRSTEFLIARDAGGKVIRSLSSDTLKAIVRQLDIAHAYPRYLRATMETSAEGRQARRLEARVRQARMRLDAEQARLSAFQPGEPGSFSTAHRFRGYRWARAIATAPVSASRPRVDGDHVVARQLSFKGATLQDVLWIGTDTTTLPGILLYTPDAPDGISFREFANHDEVIKRFLEAPAFETYLLDRLPREFGTVSANGVRRFRLSEGERRFRWVFNLDDGSGPVRAAQFENKAVGTNIFEAMYDAKVATVARDAASATRSAAEAEADYLLPDVTFESLGRGIAGLLGRPFQASWRAYDAMRAGDHRQAFVDLTDAYVSSLDYIALASMPQALAGSVVVRSARRGPGTVASGRRLPDPASRFDDRFIARGIALRDATSMKDGVYRVRGRSYIEKDNKVYGVRREGQTWRLTHPDSATYAPHIARRSDGTWGYLGLDGGLEPLPFRWLMAPDDTAYAALTFHQRFVFQETLIARTSPAEARVIVRQVADDPINGLTVGLTPQQARHWRAAMDTARAAPPERLPAAAAAARAARPAPWVPPANVDELLPAQWPDTLWYYPPAQDTFPIRTGQHLVLSQSRHNASGTVGVGALSMGPRSPWAALSTIAGGPRLTPGRLPAVFEWVSINLRAMRTRVDASGQRAFRVFAVRNGTQRHYLIRPSGHDTEAWLATGEFETGIAFVTRADLDAAAAAAPGPSN